MDAAADLILTASALVLAALAAAAAGARFGAPLLLVFLAVGLLGGAEGPGGIVVDDPDLAFAAASAALAVILLDGALRTRPETLAEGLRPGAMLATLGVLATASLTALGAMAALRVSWWEALLIGAIVSSTDAAAVFSLLGGNGTSVRERLAATLETESGLNDPAAVFLTMAIATALAIPGGLGPLGLAGSLVWQLLVGVVVGVGAGAGLAWLKPRIRLAAGLKPILTLAGGLFAFGFAQTIGGSGFLAIYLAGLVQARAARGVVDAEARALDGFAWLAQILLFLILGLLATPSHLITVLGAAIAIAVVLVFVARPIAVFLTLAPFGFTYRERGFIAWLGLRGATPIFLGLAPAAIGTPNANLYFSIAVVVAAISLVVQGWTTPLAARLFGVGEEEGPQALRMSPMRWAAAGGALLVTIAASMWLARGADLPAAQSWSPQTVAELEQTLARNPDAVATRLPPDWETLADVETRQRLLTATLAPIVRAENARIEAERAEAERFAAAEASGAPLALREQARRDVLARAYGARYDQLDQLLRRVDGAPVSLAVGHAALMTDWGRTRAAQENNAVFGLRAYGEGGGGFASLREAVADYIQVLNTHADFADFRAARAQARAEGRRANGLELAPHIGAFAADGDAFAERVMRVIETADLVALDGASAQPPR